MILRALLQLAIEQPVSDNSALTVAVVMAVASVIATAVGGWYTYTASKRNAEATREIEKQKISNDAWDGWREDVETLRRQRREDREEYERHRDHCSQQIADLAARLDRLALERQGDRELIARFVTWGRAVVLIMREHGIVFPAPPPGVDEPDVQA